MNFDEAVVLYNEAVYDTDREQALKIIQAALDAGIQPEDVVFKIVIPAIEQMIKSFSEDFDANLAQHFMAAQIASEVVEKMIPHFKQVPITKGRVVIGSAAGDLHTLGKRIVIGCLKAMMIDVLDLGVNVSAERFVDAALEYQAQIIGISAMMAHTARGEGGCLRVRQILKERGLEKQIRIIVGGAPFRFDPELYQQIGADAWSENGISAGHIIAELLKEINA